MNAWLTVILLVISNIFMTFAWYGHLKLQEMKVFTSNTPLYVVILVSWGIALLEYTCQVPANRMGFQGNGGAFSLMQLKVIQEVVTLIVFTLFTVVFFKGEPLHWNHLAAFVWFSPYGLCSWIEFPHGKMVYSRGFVNFVKYLTNQMHYT